ncbi:MAG: CDP-alcohol phosphatidyltransferase family protein [Candidatus Hydrogenedentota bacterium]
MMPDGWKYPALAKPESDGAYCYHVQRRISGWFSIRLARRISPNAATGIDLILGVASVALVLMDQWLLGVVFVQIFGIFSCIDGEIARIQNRSSKMGDYLDTMTDRLTELLLVGAVSFSLSTRVDSVSALGAGFAFLGGVFLLSTSSEKFRSAWKTAYPKRELEKLFGFLCAGSDSRLLMLSTGLVVSELTGNASILLWLLRIWAVVMYVNFILRIWLIRRHFDREDTAEV